MLTSLNFKSVSNLVWMACVLTLLVGCSGGNPNLTAVSGTVKANGEAVSEGEIMFFPSGGGRPARAQIGPDGRYELTSFKKGDGVPLGSHDVTITAYKTQRPNNAPEANDINEETEANMAEAKIVWLIPRKFSERATSTLTAEVKKGEPNEIDFDSADFE